MVLRRTQLKRTYRLCIIPLMKESQQETSLQQFFTDAYCEAFLPDGESLRLNQVELSGGKELYLTQLPIDQPPSRSTPIGVRKANAALLFAFPDHNCIGAPSTKTEIGNSYKVSSEQIALDIKDVINTTHRHSSIELRGKYPLSQLLKLESHQKINTKTPKIKVARSYPRLETASVLQSSELSLEHLSDIVSGLSTTVVIGMKDSGIGFDTISYVQKEAWGNSNPRQTAQAYEILENAGFPIVSSPVVSRGEVVGMNRVIAKGATDRAIKLLRELAPENIHKPIDIVGLNSKGVEPPSTYKIRYEKTEEGEKKYIHIFDLLVSEGVNPNPFSKEARNLVRHLESSPVNVLIEKSGGRKKGRKYFINVDDKQRFLEFYKSLVFND